MILYSVNLLFLTAKLNYGKMKFLVSLVLTAILSYALSLFLPWWSIAIAAFLVAIFIYQKGWASFLSGFISLFLLWGTLSFIISTYNNDVLAHRVSVLFLKTDNPLLLILVTALIGAVVAGLSALTGSLARRAFS